MPTHSALGVTASLKVADLRSSLSHRIDLNQGSEYRDDFQRISNLLENGESLLERPMHTQNLGPSRDMTFLMVEAGTTKALQNKDLHDLIVTTFQGTCHIPVEASDDHSASAGRFRILRCTSRAQTARAGKELLDADDAEETSEKTGDVGVTTREHALTSPDSVESVTTSNDSGMSDGDLGMQSGRAPSPSSPWSFLRLTPPLGCFSPPRPHVSHRGSPVRMLGSTSSKLALSRRTAGSSSSKKKGNQKLKGLPSIASLSATPVTQDASVQALALSVTIAPETFKPFSNLHQSGDLKFEVFHNGILAAVGFVSARHAGAFKLNGGLQIFSGTRMHRQTEKPWVYRPGPDSNGDSNKATSKSKWILTADALKREVRARGHDADGNLSSSAKYLTALADLPLPAHLKEEDHKLGIMDVVITVGTGGKHGPGTPYLIAPTRMEDGVYVHTATEPGSTMKSSTTLQAIPETSDGLPVTEPTGPVPDSILYDSDPSNAKATEVPPPKWSLNKDQADLSPSSTCERSKVGLRKVDGTPWKFTKNLATTKVTHKNLKGEKFTRTLKQFVTNISKMNVDKHMDAWEELKGSLDPEVLKAVEEMDEGEPEEVFTTPAKTDSPMVHVEPSQALIDTTASADSTVFKRVDVVSPADGEFPATDPWNLPPPPTSTAGMIVDAIEVFQQDAVTGEAPSNDGGATGINNQGPASMDNGTEEISTKEVGQGQSVNPRLTSQVLGPEASGASALLRVEDWLPYQMECAANGRFALDGYGDDCMQRLKDLYTHHGFRAQEAFFKAWFVWQATARRRQANSSVVSKQDLFGLNSPDAILFFKTNLEINSPPATTQSRVDLALFHGLDENGPLVAFLKGLKPTKLPQKQGDAGVITKGRKKTTTGKKTANSPTSAARTDAGPDSQVQPDSTTAAPYKISHNVSALSNSPIKVPVKTKGGRVAAALTETIVTPNKRRKRTRNDLEDPPTSAPKTSTPVRRSTARSAAMPPPATPSYSRARPESPTTSALGNNRNGAMASPATRSRAIQPETRNKSGLGSGRSNNRWNPTELTHEEADKAFAVPKECDGSVLGYADEGVRQINKSRNGEFREQKLVVGMRFILI